jgi:hypothetical protein
VNLPVIAQVPHEAFTPGAPDDLHVPVDDWADPVDVDTHAWWPPSPEQILGQEPQRRALEISLALLVPIGTPCGDKDRWTIAGKQLLQVGGPQDYSHGPWGMQVPAVIYLKTVEG